MKINSKTRYATIAMIELVLSKNNFPVVLSTIANAHGISVSYLEQIFAELKKHGLIKGVRGPGGGYILAKAPEDISIAEIFLAVSDKNNLMEQRWTANSDAEERKMAQSLWLKLYLQIEGFLLSMNLAQLAYANYGPDQASLPLAGQQKVA